MADDHISERTSLLDRRRQSNRRYVDDLLPPTSSIHPTDDSGRGGNMSAPATFITPHASTPAATSTHGFKLFNKRHGSYDEDRQGLLKENTGVRVWYESYSTIGTQSKPYLSPSVNFYYLKRSLLLRLDSRPYQGRCSLAKAT